ncbi:MAG: hypothetical protein O2954_18840, partial [bacterium]|nr:hypothetical protein [bacterium]
PPRQPSLVEIPPVSLPYGYYLQNGWIRGPRQSYAITDALIDSWRVLWIGTRGLGVGRADLSDRQLEFHQYGPIAPNITALARDGDAIWFGGTSFGPDGARGITRYNLAEETWQYFESDRIIGLDDDRVYTILPDTADVWFGTLSGLVRYNRKHDRWLTYRVNRHSSGRVTALARAGNRLWIGTEEGLAVFDTQADTIRIVGGSERFNIRVLATGPKYIWAGTDYGLFRCPLNDVVWTPARSQNGLTNNRINGLMVRDNDVWATVESPAALIRLARPDTVWQRFPLSEVGGIQRVSIAADTSRVWLGTDLGAFRFDIGPKLWTQYTRSDGLTYERVQAVLLDGHFVWFGTEQGASRYHWTEDLFEITH